MSRQDMPGNRLHIWVGLHARWDASMSGYHYIPGIMPAYLDMTTCLVTATAHSSSPGGISLPSRLLHFTTVDIGQTQGAYLQVVCSPPRFSIRDVYIYTHNPGVVFTPPKVDLTCKENGSVAINRKKLTESHIALTDSQIVGEFLTSLRSLKTSHTHIS